MKTIRILITSLAICIMLMGCTFNRKPVSTMFPDMSHLEVYNGGTCIAEYDGLITITMGSIGNYNAYGHDFVLEYYEIYLNGNYVESFIDSDAMAFKFRR